MRKALAPFNVKLIDNNRSRVSGILPVASLDIFDSATGEFHPQGLYSNIIFGREGERSRDKQYSFINLRTKVFQPTYFEELRRLKGLYAEILTQRSYATWDASIKDFVKATPIDGRTGFSFFMEHFDDLRILEGKSAARKRRVKFLKKWKDKALIDYLIVLPAGLRDVTIKDDGQYEEDDVASLYRKVLGVANTINPDLMKGDDPALDARRKNLQNGLVDVYNYIMGMINGKRGFAQRKFAARRVFYSTRNVISAMETGGFDLDDPRMPHVNETFVGVNQFAKAGEPLFIRQFKQGPLADFLYDLNEEPKAINPKTLKREPITVVQKQLDKWLTNDGIVGIVNNFKEPLIQKQPVKIGKHYVKLIYIDDDTYMLLDSIDDLPEGLDKNKVRPMTWLELMYITCRDFQHKPRNLQTRFPVTGTESAYPTRPKLKSTTPALTLRERMPNGEISDNIDYEFPDIRESVFATMAVHPSRLKGLGGDHDGDMLSLTFVWGDESIDEIDAKFGNAASYVTSTGKLVLPFTTDTTNWVFRSIAGD